MREVLSKFVDQAIRYDPKLSRVQVKYQLSANGIGVNLFEVLEALDVSQLISLFELQNEEKSPIPKSSFYEQGYLGLGYIAC